MRCQLGLERQGDGRVHHGRVLDGVNRPTRACQRHSGQALPNQVVIAIRSSSRVRDRLRPRTFFCSTAKRDFIVALPPAAPTFLTTR